MCVSPTPVLFGWRSFSWMNTMNWHYFNVCYILVSYNGQVCERMVKWHQYWLCEYVNVWCHLLFLIFDELKWLADSAKLTGTLRHLCTLYQEKLTLTLNCTATSACYWNCRQSTTAPWNVLFFILVSTYFQSPVWYKSVSAITSTIF